MDFLKSHFIMVLGSLLGAYLLSYCFRFNFVMNFFENLQIKSKQKKIKIIFLVIGLLFLVLGYLTKPVFYYPNSIGTIGDNYIYMTHAMGKTNFVRPHHLIFPLIVEKTAGFLERINFLNPKEEMYLEKSFLIGSLPVRIIVFLSLIGVGVLFFILFQFFYLAILGFFIFGLSYAPWIWGIQDNATGIGIAFQMFTFFMIGLFLKTKKNVFLILTGFFTSLCVYTHNSLGYFAIGVFFAIFYFIFLGEQKVLFKERLKRFILFLIPVLAMATIYYFLAAYLLGTKNIFVLLDKISDRGYFRDTPFFYGFTSVNAFLSSAKDIIVITIFNITNYLKPINFLEEVETVFMLLGLGGCVFLIVQNLKKYFKEIIQNPLVIISIVTFIIISLGYFITPVYLHYFSILAVPTLIFILVSLFTIAKKSKNLMFASVFFLIILSIGLFSYNGFSSKSVLRGRNVLDNKFYREYYNIEKVAKYENKVKFLTMNVGFSVYGDNAVLAYYYKKFKNIERVTDFPTEPTLLSDYLNNVLDNLDNNAFVFIDLDIYNLLVQTGNTFKIKKIDNVFYITK